MKNLEKSEKKRNPKNRPRILVKKQKRKILSHYNFGKCAVKVCQKSVKRQLPLREWISKLRKKWIFGTPQIPSKSVEFMKSPTGIG